MKLSSDWKEIKEIIVYGLGDTARIYLDDLCKAIRVRFIIENGKHVSQSYNGIPVYSFEESIGKIQDTKIVIIAQTTALSQISKSLVSNGYKENIDFTSIERFVMEWFYMRYKKLYMLEAHTAVTTFCTFNCKNCNMFLPYYKKRFSYSFGDLKENIDSLFEHVDYMYKYQLVGGEPFLNKYLEEFLWYLKSRYTDKIAQIWHFSNGNVIPDKGLVQALKANGCEVWLSKYDNIIDYGERFQYVESLLRGNDISVQVRKNVRWTDYGFPHKPCHYSPEEAANHTLLCGTTFHGLQENKLYYCNCAWSASQTGLHELKKDDFMELTNRGKNECTKKDIINLCLGEMESGYHSFCCLCGGLGEDNITSVQAGIQV